ncbi:ABC transporter ATP-binding protein [Aridibaculum aurantiacum]|uniref:ABC transporter ATP-binding protein n=1 Tax=Aridibaculum aurantiacum TaxID=2810307 RepID=UPI001A9712D6|nr:ATP-binding cassette domain-containing protein [Aridibaculum aurantiacum]
MTIKLTNAGKRFNRDWIFKQLSTEIFPGNTVAITGANGSGKSTLLQVISGNMAINEGKVEWQVDEKLVDEEKVHQHLSIAAPYLEVIEEMTATEFLQFHHQFKKLIPGISIEEILQIIGLQQAAHKQIRYYSSGMKQRVKLAQAFFSDVPLLLLDEPCTNLDATGIALYHKLVEDYTKGKTVIVSSNDEVEYAFCKRTLSIMDYK